MTYRGCLQQDVNVSEDTEVQRLEGGDQTSRDETESNRSSEASAIAGIFLLAVEGGVCIAGADTGQPRGQVRRRDVAQRRGDGCPAMKAAECRQMKEVYGRNSL